MKILHINTEASHGGAAIAARRHCEAMRKMGIDATLLSLYGQTDKMTTISTHQKEALKNKKRWGWIYHKLNRLIVKPVAWHWLKVDYDVTRMKIVQEADIIYIHWINEFLGLNAINALVASGKKIIWYMHDMWPITGGCHYSFECDGYMKDCKRCPFLKLWKNRSAEILKKKKEAWSGHQNLILAAPSQWLTTCIEKSTLFKTHPTFCIPNVIDTTLYCPHEKLKARSILGLPKDKKIILFSGMGAFNPYKGTIYLIKALIKLSKTDYEFVVVGHCDKNIFPLQVQEKIHLLGFISEEEKMIQAYNASDVLLITSIADNFPNVVIEAMACGIPVVGFATGGIKDQIHHQQNGWLVEPKDIEGIVDGVKWVLEEANYAMLQRNAREYVENNCSYKNVLKIHEPILDLVK